MPKIIINYPDDMEPGIALDYVKKVVHQGRTSVTSSGDKHFCWITAFLGTGVHVLTQQRRKLNRPDTDSFVVRRTSD